MIERLFPLIGTGSLVALVALLGVKATDVFKMEFLQPAMPSTLNVPATAASPARITQRPAVYYAAITERPVFDPSRRPYAPEAEAQASSPEPVIETSSSAAPDEIPQPEVTLQGIIIGDNQNAALVSVNGETPSWVAQGASIAGWSLEKIGNDWIEISRDARSIRVDMYE